MPWLTLLRLALSLTARIASIVREKRLMDVGAAHAMRDVLMTHDAQVRAAQDARRKVRKVLNRHPDAVRDNDGYRRD